MEEQIQVGLQFWYITITKCLTLTNVHGVKLKENSNIKVELQIIGPFCPKSNFKL